MIDLIYDTKYFNCKGKKLNSKKIYNRIKSQEYVIKAVSKWHEEADKMRLSHVISTNDN